MPDIGLTSYVTKRIIGKKRAKGEERHLESLTTPPLPHPQLALRV
jgi:hypothetical protein